METPTAMFMAAVRAIPVGQLVIAGCALLIAIVTFFVNAGNRAAIDRALRGSRSAHLGMFNLARSDAMTMLNQKALAVPERLWTYDNFYLERFARAARAARPRDARTALDLYCGQTLHWDVAYAIALGIFAVVFDYSVATSLVSDTWCSNIVLFCASMGIVYGAADVAEDLKLTSILKDWQHGDAAAPIDGGEAGAANALTRIKFVAILLSVAGVVVFGILSAVAAVIYRSPHSPAATPEPEYQVATN